MDAQQETEFYGSQDCCKDKRRKAQADDFWHYTSEDGEAWKRYLEEQKDAKQVKENK